MEWTEEHERLATAKRIAHLYSDNRLGQMAIEGVILLGDWVDKLNAEATRTEVERITKLHQEQLKKEQENQIKPPPPGAPGALGVVNDPVKPITPAGEALKLVEPTQHLEVPAHRLQVPYYEVKKEFEVPSRVFEIKEPRMAFEHGPKMEFEHKKEFAFQKDKGITIG